jgi:hypothetical protein
MSSVKIDQEHQTAKSLLSDHAPLALVAILKLVHPRCQLIADSVKCLRSRGNPCLDRFKIGGLGTREPGKGLFTVLAVKKRFF